MEKYNYRPEDLFEWQGQIAEDIRTLESTEGYWQLTPKQRQIIRVSLMLQERAERGMHPQHKNDPWYYDWNKNNKYQDSLDHISNWYCHVVVNGLEKEDLSEKRPRPCNFSFFDGSYFFVKDESQIDNALETFGFPCVVHIGSENSNLHGEDNRYHTFLALGRDDNGEIVVWEKIRKGEPYRLTRLGVVFNDYGKNLFWGVRSLGGGSAT